jgi:predicted phage terminase large subunit-like protein
VFHSWDTATAAGELNDYSVCTVWGVVGKYYYLVDVIRKKLDYPHLRNLAIKLIEDYPPDFILVEDAVTGRTLAQKLRMDHHQRTIALKPSGDKEVRFSAQSALIEQGRVLLPEEAPWLDESLK